VFPYSYFDTIEKFKETELPPIENFRNDLTDEDCSVEGKYIAPLYNSY